MARNVRDALVQDRVRQGLLPRERPVKVSSLYGVGRICVVCLVRINPPELQYECVMSNGETFHFCRECYFVWLSELDVNASSDR
jgi:hypothetical protein